MVSPKRLLTPIEDEIRRRHFCAHGFHRSLSLARADPSRSSSRRPFVASISQSIGATFISCFDLGYPLGNRIGREIESSG